MVCWLLTAGDQVPEMPFNELVGRAAIVAPEQMALTGAKLGVRLGEMLMVNIVVLAHCPELGVKV